MKNAACLLFTAVLLAFAFAPGMLMAQAGGLDPDFSGDGLATLEFGGIDVVQAIALDDDQNIYAVGYAVEGAGPYKNIAVAKFFPDGALDPVFGGDGSVTTDLGYGYDDFGYAIQIQPDGKILVAGSTYDGEGYKMCALRYRADGSLDPIFGTGGKTVIDFGGPDDAARSIALLDDGRILLGGYRMEMVTATMYKRNFAAVRLTDNGLPDATFGEDGKVATPFSSDRHASAFSMAVQFDGKIILAGYSYVGTSANYQFALTRYLPDGTLDPGFDGDGMLLVSTGLALGEAYALCVQGDNRILVAGKIYDGFDTNVGLLRFNNDGSLDNTFGAGGLVETTWGTGELEGANGMTLQWDGRIVVTGFKGNGTSLQTILMRYETDGSPDAAFGTDGKLGYNASVEADAGNAVLVQPDGKFLVGGFYDNGPDNDFALMRFLSDPGTAVEATVPDLFNAMPNPAHDMTFFSLPDAGALLLYSINGKLIYNEQVQEGSYALSVSNFPAGIYLAELRCAGKTYNLKLLVE